MKHNYVAIFVLCLSCGKITGTNTESLTYSDNGGWLEAGSAGKTNIDSNQGGFAGAGVEAGSAGEMIHTTNHSGSAGTVVNVGGSVSATGGFSSSGAPTISNGGSSGSAGRIEEASKSTGGLGGGKYTVEQAGMVHSINGEAGSAGSSGSSPIVNGGEAGTDNNSYTVVDDMSSLDGWLLDPNNTGSNPEITVESSGETIMFSAAGDRTEACGTLYNYKEYQFDQPILSNSIELCFELDASGFTEEPSYYNFSSVSIELYDDDNNLNIRNFFYTAESIGEYWEQNQLTNDFVELASDGCQQIPFTQDVSFNKMILYAINYTCVGTNYVIFDELRLLSNDI